MHSSSIGTRFRAMPRRGLRAALFSCEVTRPSRRAELAYFGSICTESAEKSGLREVAGLRRLQTARPLALFVVAVLTLVFSTLSGRGLFGAALSHAAAVTASVTAGSVTVGSPENHETARPVDERYSKLPRATEAADGESFEEDGSDSGILAGGSRRKDRLWLWHVMSAAPATEPRRGLPTLLIADPTRGPPVRELGLPARAS